ncbi:MAG: hypothetical protein ACRDK9_11480, partial [Solirubrobacterales bacterium]
MSASEPPPGAPETAAGLPPVPDDAGDTRGRHLRRLLGHPATLIITLVVAIAAFVAVAAAGHPLFGLAAAGVVALFALLIVFLLARSAAAEDFFNAYARGRGLRRTSGKSGLPPLSPLLQRGERRYSEQRFDGVLPGGLDGSLAHYTYEEETRDSDGNRQTSYFHFTVAISQIPGAATLTRELFCQRRVGFRFLDAAEDVFRRRQRVEHESDAVDRKFEIFIGADDDPNRARQVLSPSFLVWLADHCPEEFAFEVVAGALVTNLKGHKKTAAELDELCQA